MNLKSDLLMPVILTLGLFLGLLALLSVSQSAAQAELNAPNVRSIRPSFGWNHVDTWVKIYGDSFVEPLTVTLDSIPLTIKEVRSDRIEAIIPAGLPPRLYDVTVETEDGPVTRLALYKVLEPTEVDDLTSFPHWLWTDLKQLRVGQINSGVGLNVQRLGGSRETGVLDHVTVEFVLLTENRVLGRSDTSPLAPTFVEPTRKVIWEPEDTKPGELERYTICAIIDPDNEIAETDETNNEICRTVTVLDDKELDIVAPVVDDNFKIEDRAPSTLDVEVTLDVTAEDMRPEPISGVSALQYIEYEYNLASGNWVPLQRRPWVPYGTGYKDYPWTLTTTYGIRYMRVWATEKADNISLDSSMDEINLVPSEQAAFVAEGEVDFYRILVNAGETLSATLTPSSGDPDLRIWAPSGVLEADSNSPTGVDSVSIEALETGTYQIEVYGHTEAQYRLTFGTTGVPAGALRGFQSASKEKPQVPMVRLDDTPEKDWPETQVDESQNNDLNPAIFIYLPMTIRSE